MFRFAGNSFKRNPNYDKDCNKKNSGFVSEDSYGKRFLENYDYFKEENKSKFLSGIGDKSKERQILDKLNCHTFSKNKSTVVVIDVEININEDSGKKCDMVLLNTVTTEIMFVESKIYQNKNLGISGGNEPDVIGQACGYTKTNDEHKSKIELAYGEHIKIVNNLFGSTFPTKITLVLPTKLLVYNDKLTHTPRRKTANELINKHVGENNIMWNFSGNEPSLDKIWKKLTKTS